MITDGALVNGPCFRLSGRATSSHFFDNLRRVDSNTGTIYRRGNDLITEFPERLTLSFEMYDWPCPDKLQPAAARTRLDQNGDEFAADEFLLETWDGAASAPGIVRTHAEAQPIEPYGGDQIKGRHAALRVVVQFRRAQRRRPADRQPRHHSAHGRWPHRRPRSRPNVVANPCSGPPSEAGALPDQRNSIFQLIESGENQN